MAERTGAPLEIAAIDKRARIVGARGEGWGSGLSPHSRAIPIFREAEVESNFGVFERIALILRWPKDVWAILL